MTTPNHVYLIDGNAYIYRAYHAIAPLSNTAGLPTHAVFGFTNILHRVLKEKNPHFLAIAFDTKGPNFRHALYHAYKANRPPMPEDLVVQIPYIKELVAAHNILTFEDPDVEADDLIASAALKLAENNCQVTIVSGDKDLLQLIGDRITVWDPMNNRVMDRSFVLKKYKVPPEQLLDLFALIGDSADNVPGVPGVGPKTAEKLINQFCSLDSLYDSLEQLPKNKLRERLHTHKDAAFLSRRLIRLKSSLAVTDNAADYRLPEPDLDHLNKLYTELEFTRLIQKTAPTRSFDTQSFHLVQHGAAVDKLKKELATVTTLALDTETTSLDPLKAELVGISLAYDETKAYYLPVSHHDNEGTLVPGQMSLKQAQDILAPLLQNPEIHILGHNLKYDLAVLVQNGFTVTAQLLDTMIASYLLDPEKRSHKLDTLVAEQGIALTSFEAATDGAKEEDCFRFVGLEKAKNYSCEDVAGTWLLWQHFRSRLDEGGLMSLFTNVETPLIPVLVAMETAGIRVDRALLRTLSQEFGGKLEALHAQIVTLAGKEFNLNSPQQLSTILFDELKLPHGRKTKTGYSTDMKVLEKLAPLHDLPKNIIEYRNLSKLKSTYIDKLESLIHPKTERIHTSFNQTVTATGRLSSSEPNLQNIPIRTAEGQKIREAFIPREGALFISADYSQIDLRVLAHYSEDPTLITAFREGQDIHQKTAAEIFRTNQSLVTGEMRRVAKSINFGIVYGMSAFGLASQLHITRKEAGLFIDRYFAHYKGVKNFMERSISQAKENGFVTTLLGRKRFLADINSPNKNKREFAERIALNTPIQGTAADIVKIATIEVAHQLAAQKLKAQILLQIHDELVIEAPKEECEQAAILLKETMENCFELAVPLVVNVQSGVNLAKA